MTRTERLDGLVEELRAAAPQPRTVGWLARRFETSERSVQRDLEAVRGRGVPVRFEPGPTGGWCFDPEMPVGPIAFSAEEVAAVACALAAAGDSVPFADAAQSAVSKLIAAGAPATREVLAQVLQLPTRTTAAARPQVDPAVRRVVETAITNRRVVRLTYLDGHGRGSERDVEPAGLLSASGRWYLVGWCRTRQDGRGFRLDRIQSAEVLAEVARDRDMASILGPLGRGTATPAVLESLIRR